MRIALLLVLTVTANLAHAAALDGTTFQIVVTDEKGQQLPAELLIFAEDTLSSPAISKRHGFAAGHYTVERHAKGAQLTSTLLSKKHGQVVFSAVITTDGAIDGTRTWTKRDLDPIVHTFTGQRQ